MRLFRLTVATIFQRKSWAICLFAVIALPFLLPWVSSASEKPILLQPARIQTVWGTLWICTLFWGFFTAAREGENNVKSGIGEYFHASGLSATRQLLAIWLGVLCFIAPLTLVAAAICQLTTAPSDSLEHSMWLVLNAQYLTLFLLTCAPLLALAIALASRFGGITGFTVTLLLTVYGLYGVGYLEHMLKLEPNPILQGIWLFSPHYNLADLTQRLYFKTGSLPQHAFTTLILYFTSILAVTTGISRLCFRPKA